MACNDLRLEQGMCFSIEPGMYLAGRHGARIEDIVTVTATCVERLNRTGHELPDELLTDAGVIYVDQRDAILEESGEVIHALASGAIVETSLIEIGEVLGGGTVSRSGRTAFKTVGVAMQDWAIVRLLAEAVKWIGLVLEMRVRRRADHERMPWPNGGGTNAQVAASSPADPNLIDYRISFAEVDRSGPFSTFCRC